MTAAPGGLPGVSPSPAIEPCVTDPDDPFTHYVLPELEVLGRVAMSLTRNRADAEDLVQETLLRAHRAIGRFDGRHPRAWLLTILRNTHLNSVRKRRPELLRDAEAADRLASAGPADDGATAEDTVVDAAFDGVVGVAFRSLPDRFRSVVELVDLGGLSYQEAADALGVPIGTVMSRLHRGRARIRDHLHAEGIAPRSAS
jgi:RNA polymerase sigma-70 factor (ECF subfamily)